MLSYCGAGGGFGVGHGRRSGCASRCNFGPAVFRDGAEGVLEVLFVELPFAIFEDGAVFVGAADPGAGGAVALASFLDEAQGAGDAAVFGDSEM